MWNLVQSRRQGKAAPSRPRRTESHPGGRSFCEAVGDRTPGPIPLLSQRIHATSTAALLALGIPERGTWKDIDLTVSRTRGRIGGTEETQQGCAGKLELRGCWCPPKKAGLARTKPRNWYCLHRQGCQ